MNVTIHAQPQIKWQGSFSEKMAAGLRRLGISFEVTNERRRVSDAPAIVLGTSLWRQVEATGRYLLVDRCSFGDTNRYVSLVWDGHGRRGNHCVPDNYSFSRWAQHGVPLAPFRPGSKIVLCGQAESYCDMDLADWYQRVSPLVTHFRPHPAVPAIPVTLPVWRSWDDVGAAWTLNSSVAIDALANGVYAFVCDEGGMAFGWRTPPLENDGDDPDYPTREEARLRLMRWLAWTQFSHEEIADGEPIRHLFDFL